MNAGKFSDLVTVQKRKIVTNAYNQQVVTWDAGDFTLHAEAVRVSELVARFNIRYLEEIETSPADYRVLFFGRIWVISHAIRDRRRTILTLESDSSSLIEVTTLESTEREYIEGEISVRPLSE